MTTTRETLATLMTLVDKHTDDLKEGEYLAVCNLLRDLHRGAHVMQAARVTDFPPYSEGWMTQRRLETTGRRLELHTSSSARVKISDKMDVMRTHYPDIFSMTCENPLLPLLMSPSTRIFHMENHVIGDGADKAARKRALTRLYQARRDQRHETERATIVATITALTERLSQLTPP